jgi:hypothetical protein
MMKDWRYVVESLELPREHAIFEVDKGTKNHLTWMSRSSFAPWYRLGVGVVKIPRSRVVVQGDCHAAVNTDQESRLPA